MRRQLAAVVLAAITLGGCREASSAVGEATAAFHQALRRQADKSWQFAREVYNSSVPPGAVAAK